MVTYTVHEPPAPEADRIDRGTELEFVKDGFSWLTTIVPPLGMIARGLWLAAAAYLVIVGLLVWGLVTLGADPSWICLIVLLIGIYLGFEVSTLKRFMLDRAGWRMLGVVNGKTIAECERRFLENWLPGQPLIAAAATNSAARQESAVPVGLGKVRWSFGRWG